MLIPRLATMEDVDYLAPRLRQADLDEIQAASGRCPREVLLQGLEVSEPAFVGADEWGTPIVMFGACTHEPGLAAVWLLSTDDLYNHRISFLRQSRKGMDAVNRKWPVLFNYCDARNVVHINWLRGLGFTFIARHEHYGVERRPFLEFVRVNFSV